MRFSFIKSTCIFYVHVACGVYKCSEKFLQANIKLVMLALSRKRKKWWIMEWMGHDYWYMRAIIWLSFRYQGRHFKRSHLCRIWKQIEISDVKKERGTFDVDKKKKITCRVICLHGTASCSGWFYLWGISKALVECSGKSHSLKGNNAYIRNLNFLWPFDKSLKNFKWGIVMSKFLFWKCHFDNQV